MEPGNSLDALVAAPDHHALLLENDEVRVLDTRVGPGEIVPVHAHVWPGIVYVVSMGHFIRRHRDGTVVADTRDSASLPSNGTAIWTPALPPHSLENVSTSEICAIHVELKR